MHKINQNVLMMIRENVIIKMSKEKNSCDSFVRAAQHEGSVGDIDRFYFNIAWI